jgi:MSHA biogenesis protein MshI
VLGNWPGIQAHWCLESPLQKFRFWYKGIGKLLDFFAKKKGKQGLVGITAGADKLCLAHVVQDNGRPALACCEEFSAASDKETGDILARQVRAHGLENTPANFVLDPSDYKLFLVEPPRVEAQEMESAIKWKIKDLVDSPVNELAVTLFPVPDDAYRGQNDMVYVVAARKSRIKQIVNLVVNAGLALESIDIPELVLMNITRSFSDDSNGLAFIDLRSSGSTLNLCRDGMIYLTRHLNTRVEQGIITSLEWESVRERLVLEIQRSLDYYESQMGQTPITRILVAPRGEDTGQLVSQLDQSMSVQVTALDLAGDLGNQEQLPPTLQQSCILAIGGAMRNTTMRHTRAAA